MIKNKEFKCIITLDLSRDDLENIKTWRDKILKMTEVKKDKEFAELYSFLDELIPLVTPRLDSDIPTPEEIEEDAKYYAEHPEEL